MGGGAANNQADGKGEIYRVLKTLSGNSKLTSVAALYCHMLAVSYEFPDKHSVQRMSKPQINVINPKRNPMFMDLIGEKKHRKSTEDSFIAEKNHKFPW